MYASPDADCSADDDDEDDEQNECSFRNTNKHQLVVRPKKPLSAYIYFSQEYREKLKE